MGKTEYLLALDVGEKRIGVAQADSQVRIAVPLGAVLVDGQELATLRQHIKDTRADRLIVGYPRNQSGEPTKQTAFVEQFVARLNPDVPVHYQDESLTSVLAKERIGGSISRRQREKGVVDAEAAVIILEDYLEQTYGH
ncbi:Holliday junction resolvase RuvX [Candidatus Saccharibacteria bacterium]|nr:Holliday junction resolvase RuvX [Candidatus Saccharibacteria bacterium]